MAEAQTWWVGGHGTTRHSLRRGWRPRALTSLRDGKRSVPESRPLSPSWESRESCPGEERAYVGGGAVAWGPAWAQEGEADTFPPFPVSLRSDALHPTSGSLWASAGSYHLLSERPRLCLRETRPQPTTFLSGSTRLQSRERLPGSRAPGWWASWGLDPHQPRSTLARTLRGKLPFPRPPSLCANAAFSPCPPARSAGPQPVFLGSARWGGEQGDLGRRAGVRTSPSDALWLASPHGRGASCKRKVRGWARFVSLSRTRAFLWGVPPRPRSQHPRQAAALPALSPQQRPGRELLRPWQSVRRARALTCRRSFALTGSFRAHGRAAPTPQHPLPWSVGPGGASQQGPGSSSAGLRRGGPAPKDRTAVTVRHAREARFSGPHLGCWQRCRPCDQGANGSPDRA